MKRKRDPNRLDDVLDLYLTRSEAGRKGALEELINDFPEYEEDLQRCSELIQIDLSVRERNLTPEEEQVLKSRAVSIVQNALYRKHHGLAAGAQASEIHQSGKRQNASTMRAPNRHIARAVLSAEIVYQLYAEPTFGRVKHQKVFHLCEHIAEIGDIQGEYRRQAAGPLDNRLIYSVEAELKRQNWFETYEREPLGHGYRPLSGVGRHRKYLERWWPDKKGTILRIIRLMRSWDTRACEIFSTLYAAWNDLIILGKQVTDDAIIEEVCERWHDSKKAIPERRWRDAIAWMRREQLVPVGFGQATIPGNRARQ